MTTVTSGQKCCALYKKQGQLGSLVRMLLGSLTWHSTRCALTWKVKVTKSNRSLFQLAPLTRHTEETGFGLWATPNSMDSLPPRQAEDCSTNQKNREGRSRSGNLREQVVHPQMWPTPSACPRGAHTGARSGAVSEDGKTRTSANGTRWGATLQTAVRMWPTPSANEDAAGTPNGNMQKMLGNHPDIRGTTPEEWQRGSLNPAWVEWLMGYPIGHTDLKDWATPSSRKSRQKSSDASTK